MAVLTILRYPDPRLHRVAEPVERVNDSIRQLIDDMAETMYLAPGIGLAATQVDRHIRVIVMDVTEEKNDLRVFINPQLLASSDERKTYEEGCLSVPGIYEEVERPESIVVKALDRDGKVFELEAQGLLAVCLQHEMDHLNGKVFVQYLSRLKQSRIKTRLTKAEKSERLDKDDHSAPDPSSTASSSVL